MASDEEREGQTDEASKPENHGEMTEEVSGQIRRKMRARERSDRSVWFGLGMFGLVGWSVAIPTLAGLAFGIWLDRRFGTGLTWTMALLLLGIGLGCWNAWHWIQDERRSAAEDQEVES